MMPAHSPLLAMSSATGEWGIVEGASVVLMRAYPFLPKRSIEASATPVKRWRFWEWVRGR